MKPRIFQHESCLYAFLEEQRKKGNLCWNVRIMHDDKCTRVRCVCSPEYSAEPMSVEATIRDQKAQAKWIARTQS